MLSASNNDLIVSYFISEKLPAPIFEYKFHNIRRWRFDWAWLEQRVALEIQGGIFIMGRHSRGAALLKEWEKLNAAAIMGWRILYCQPSDLFKGKIFSPKQEIINIIKQALNIGNKNG